MVTAKKIIFPDEIQDSIDDYVSFLTEDGFFDDPDSFPPNTIENGRTNLSNFIGEALMPKFLEGGSTNYLVSLQEMEKILVDTIIQANLDSLMIDKLVDGIENEDGEMVYWLTDKGKEVYENEKEENC